MVNWTCCYPAGQTMVRVAVQFFPPLKRLLGQVAPRPVVIHFHLWALGKDHQAKPDKVHIRQMGMKASNLDGMGEGL